MALVKLTSPALQNEGVVVVSRVEVRRAVHAAANVVVAVNVLAINVGFEILLVT